MSLSILLVEDSPTDAAILMAAFEEIGYENQIEVANNGLVAIETLEAIAQAPDKEMPKLILLDLNLPRKGGLEVLKAIKQNSVWKKIPTVVFSSSSSQADIDSSYCCHANAYLCKPRELSEYRMIVQRLHSFWVETAELPSL